MSRAVSHRHRERPGRRKQPRPENRGFATPCLIWQGYKNRDGYGMTTDSTSSKRSSTGAHRVAWQRVNGPVPSGMDLDHLCRQRDCVNPDHLEPVAHAENARRGAKAKLTKEQVQAIRLDQRRQIDIAASYGISQSTVSSVKRFASWSKDMEAAGAS